MLGNVILVAEILTTVQVCDATGDSSSTKGDIQKIGGYPAKLLFKR